MNAVYASTIPLRREDRATASACTAQAGAAGALPHHALQQARPSSTPSPSGAATATLRLHRRSRARRSPRRRRGRKARRRWRCRAWVEAVGDLRGSSPEQRDAPLRAPRGHAVLAMRSARDRGAAAPRRGHGLAIVEDDSRGPLRHRHARAVAAPARAVRAVWSRRSSRWRVARRRARMRTCRSRRDNAAARRLYRDVRLPERYLYWYRGRDGRAPYERATDITALARQLGEACVAAGRDIARRWLSRAPAAAWRRRSRASRAARRGSTAASCTYSNAAKEEHARREGGDAR